MANLLLHFINIVLYRVFLISYSMQDVLFILCSLCIFKHIFISSFGIVKCNCVAWNFFRQRDHFSIDFVCIFVYIL